MKRVVKTIVAVVLLCLTVVSCSKESLADQDTFYEIQATEGDNGSDEDKPGN